MTPADLASICRWGTRKPACHVAMCKAGFVDKLTPKGFAAHEWNEHNAKILQSWEAGKKGGRPPKEENANELPSNENPTDNRTVTHRQPDESLDKTRPDRVDREDQTRPDASPSSTPHGNSGLGSESLVAGVGLDGLVSGIASNAKALLFTPPTVEQVKNLLRMHFDGAQRFAESFHKTMTKQRWRDKERKALTSWQSVAKQYASKAALNSR